MSSIAVFTAAISGFTAAVFTAAISGFTAAVTNAWLIHIVQKYAERKSSTGLGFRV